MIDLFAFSVVFCAVVWITVQEGIRWDRVAATFVVITFWLAVVIIGAIVSWWLALAIALTMGAFVMALVLGDA